MLTRSLGGAGTGRVPTSHRQRGTENRQAMLVVGDRRPVDLPGRGREAQVGGKSSRYQISRVDTR